MSEVAVESVKAFAIYVGFAYVIIMGGLATIVVMKLLFKR